jgi:hypothetical protein
MLRGSRSSSNTEDPVAVNPGIQMNTNRYVRLEGLYTSSSLQPYFSKEPAMRSGIEMQDKIGEANLNNYDKRMCENIIHGFS